MKTRYEPIGETEIKNWVMQNEIWVDLDKHIETDRELN